jgi:diguanylate cyclase (GGDEF)-like protein
LASEICRAPIAAVSLIDANRQWFKSKVGLMVSETSRDVAFCAHTILTPDLLIVPDARDDKRFADNPLVTGEPGIRFYAGAPLLTPGGDALGSLCVIDHVQRELSAAQANSLRALSRQVMAHLELRRHVGLREQYAKQLEQYQERLMDANALLLAQSITDDVTGFHNTRYLHQFLDECLDQGANGTKKLSLVFFDMDHFKSVVDTHGHLIGAKVLQKVATVVHQQLGEKDRIIRYGGDEFVVILPGQSRAQALAKAERMRQSIGAAEFLQDEGVAIRVTASFGVATYPEDASDKKHLLMEADRHLFQSKKDGKNRVTA